MSEELTPRQQILLWDLISRGGSALQKDLRPEVGPKDREPLLKRRYIAVTKEKGNAIRLGIEEPGWDRLAANAPDLLSSGIGSKYDRPILQFVLAQLQRYAVSNSVAIAAIFAVRPKDEGESSPIEQQIVDAFYAIAGRPARDHVRLSALRAKLSHVPRPQLDQSLLAMRRDGRANLINLDNPRDIAAEGDAALEDVNQTFHILWIDS